MSVRLSRQSGSPAPVAPRRLSDARACVSVCAGRRRCKALFSYSPDKADELALKLNDVIDVLEEVEPGWWKGSLNGKVRNIGEGSACSGGHPPASDGRLGLRCGSSYFGETIEMRPISADWSVAITSTCSDGSLTR